jgi:hypothetical protein
VLDDLFSVRPSFAQRVIDWAPPLPFVGSLRPLLGPVLDTTEDAIERRRLERLSHLAPAALDDAAPGPRQPEAGEARRVSRHPHPHDGPV